MKKNNFLIWMVTFSLLAAGCARVPKHTTGFVSVPPPVGMVAGGIYHTVEHGQTFYKISKIYHVDLNELMRVNHAANPSQLEVGQRLLIPGRSSRPDPLVPTPLRDVGRVPEGQDEFVWPVRGKIVSVFGMRRGGALNKGIDIQASGGTQVMASRGGIVSFVHQGLPGFGKTVILDHGDGFATVYAYIGEILVRQGEVVSQRQVIARVGKSGRTEVPALHFEIRYHQRPKNPFYYLSLNLRKGYAADAVV